jgi:hypothetical protein
MNVVTACIFLVQLAAGTPAAVDFNDVRLYRPAPDNRTQIVFENGDTETIRATMAQISTALANRAACKG